MSVSKNVTDVLAENRFVNYKQQLTAWRLSAEFNKTFQESYLWNRALFLSTNGCLLLSDLSNKRLALKCLKESAEIYEGLSSISEEYDKEYCLILSSICFDLAGYQANAYCLIKGLHEYSLSFLNDSKGYDNEGSSIEIPVNKVEIGIDNFILTQIKFILEKKISKARALLTDTTIADIGVKLIQKSLYSWYDNVLNGTLNNYQEEIDNSYRYFLMSANVHVSHLLFLLKYRLKVYEERSIWKNLQLQTSITDNNTWKRYIRLLSHDIYDQNTIKSIDNRISKFEFWTSQLRAVEIGILATNDSYVVQMPTSAGKTFIAELLIIDSLLKFPDKKCIYIAPFRALSNEKETELADYISKLGYSVSALSGSYEVDEFQELILNETDVLIATPEKIDLLLRLNPDYFNLISLIVVDEGHIVGDISSRSSLLEFLIIRLRIKVSNLRLLFISAVMPSANADEYSIWLSGQRNKVIRSLQHSDSSIDEEWEPTRKLIGDFTWIGNNGRISYVNIETENEDTRIKTGAFVPAIISKRQYADRFPNGTAKKETSACLAYKLAEDGNCLIFCAQPRETKYVGEAFLALLISLGAQSIQDHFSFNDTSESYFFSKKWYGEDSYITKCISRGIGIHFGDMPEAVRRSVESDYKLGFLRVLISTNTIGQGINFPIKYLIIHSTIIFKSDTVSVRDFWNLVGRAGRAGKETEGQVIFVINTWTDRQSYERYINKGNIDPALSMFFNVLNALVRSRINQTTFEGYIRILSESYLLSILAEEVVQSDIEAAIEKIIDISLFKVQALERNIDIAPIRVTFKKIAKGIKDEISIELIKVFGETGLSLKSNQAIYNNIEANKGELVQIVNEDDYEKLLEHILLLFDDETIDEIKSQKLEKTKIKPSLFLTITKEWINGSDIQQLQIEWLKLSSEISHLHILISEGYYFRYTWVISSFVSILRFSLEISNDELPDGIRSLSSYIKYGVNNPTACLARSLGVKNRDIALLLAQKAFPNVKREFIRWFSNINEEDVNGFGLNIFDTKNILNISLKLTPNKYDRLPNSFDFQIKEIPFLTSRMLGSQRISIGDILTYKRDQSNEYDPFAIKIYIEDSEIGYVPKEFSKPEFD